MSSRWPYQSRSKPTRGRMEPGHVLRVAEGVRRPQQAIRPGLVEPDAIGRLRRRTFVERPRSASCRQRHRWPPVGPASRARRSRSPRGAPSAVRGGPRRNTSESKMTRIAARGVSSSSAACVRASSSWWRTSARSRERPTCSRLPRRALELDRHVVRVDLGADAVEQDPPLAADGRRRAAAGAVAGASASVSASTIAPRNWLRTCSPRSATASDAARIASAPRGRTRGPEQAGTSRAMPRHRSFAVHHGPREQPFLVVASARTEAARATSGSAWIPA